MTTGDIKLLLYRERCLEEASKRPLFKPPKVATGDAVNYPNVFDLLGQVKREAIIFGKPVHNNLLIN